MTSYIQEEYKKEYRISQIRDQEIDYTEKVNKVQSLQEKPEEKKNDSLKTILSVANTMVGSSLVFFPGVFQTNGILTSVIVMIIIAIASCQTCKLLVFHFKQTEGDLSDTIVRILGIKWYYTFMISSIVFSFIVGIIYFGLCANMLYPFLWQVGIIEPKKDMNFSKFSFTWVVLMLAIIEFAICKMQNLNIIVKCGQFGIIAVGIYFFYIVIVGIIGMNKFRKGDQTKQDANVFTGNFGECCGIFALSFYIHSYILQIVKNNKIQKNNSRDIMFGYIICLIVNCTVGIFGTFALVFKDEKKGAQTIFDFYDANVIIEIIELLLFFQLMTVLPIIIFVTRNQFFEVVYKLNKPPQWVFYLVNFVFIFCAFFVTILNIELLIIMRLCGAIFGFNLIYTIPIVQHLKCLYGDKKQKTGQVDTRKSKFEVLQNKKTSKDAPEEKEQLKSNSEALLADEGEYAQKEYEKKNEKEGENKMTDSCLSEHETMKAYPKNLYIGLYMFIIVFGISVAIMTLYVTFLKK